MIDLIDCMYTFKEFYMNKHVGIISMKCDTEMMIELLSRVCSITNITNVIMTRHINKRYGLVQYGIKILLSGGSNH